MGRSSSTGLPFLIRRPDTQKFAYHRVIPAELAPHVAGPLNLLWASRIVELDGRSTIKISLKTGDEEMARVRWQSVHQQVEALVQFARVEVRSRRAAELAVRVKGLKPADIRHMVEQVRHDILAEDDRIYLDPTFTSPLDGVILNLLPRAGRQPNEATNRDAQRFSQDVRRRKAEQDLATRDLSLSDRPIEEREIDADPDLIAKLGALSAGAPDVLSEEERAALLAEPAGPRKISSEVDTILRRNGISLRPSHPDRKALSLGLLRAEINAFKIVEARRHGDTTETPECPETLNPPAPPAETISATRERWIELLTPGEKAKADNRLYVGRFIDLYGDLPIASVTRKMIRDFRDVLTKCPRNPPKGIAKLPLQDQVAWAGEQPNCRLLSPKRSTPRG